MDITKRLHAKLSFGPTLNILNADLRTDTYYQELATEGGVTTTGSTKVQSAVSPYTTVVNNTAVVAPTIPTKTGDFLTDTAARYKFGQNAQAYAVYLTSVPATTPKGTSYYAVSGTKQTAASSVLVDTNRSVQTTTFALATVPSKTVNVTTATNAVVNSTTTSVPTATTAVANNANNTKGSSAGMTRALPGETVKHEISESSGLQSQWGVFAQLALQLDLDRRKRWYMEAFVRYDYAPSFFVTDGATSTSIDASSWGVGLGVGVRF
jgi:hypothetical protein